MKHEEALKNVDPLESLPVAPVLSCVLVERVIANDVDATVQVGKYLVKLTKRPWDLLFPLSRFGDDPDFLHWVCIHEYTENMCVELLTEALRAGNGMAAVCLAEYNFKRGDNEAAVRFLHEPAALAVGKCHLLLARCYSTGDKGLPKDLCKAVEEFRKANCFDASMELAGLCNQVCDWRGAIEAYHSAIGFKDCDATAVLKGVRGMLPKDRDPDSWPSWIKEKVSKVLELCVALSHRVTSASSMLQVVSVLMLFGGKKRNFSKSLDLCLAAQKLPCQAPVTEPWLKGLLTSWGDDTATKCTLEVCTQVLSRVVNDQERITTFLLGHNPRCGGGSFVWRLPQFVVGDIVIMLWVQNFGTLNIVLSQLSGSFWGSLDYQCSYHHRVFLNRLDFEKKKAGKKTWMPHWKGSQLSRHQLRQQTNKKPTKSFNSSKAGAGTSRLSATKRKPELDIREKRHQNHLQHKEAVKNVDQLESLPVAPVLGGVLVEMVMANDVDATAQVGKYLVKIAVAEPDWRYLMRLFVYLDLFSHFLDPQLFRGSSSDYKTHSRNMCVELLTEALRAGNGMAAVCLAEYNFKRGDNEAAMRFLHEPAALAVGKCHLLLARCYSTGDKGLPKDLCKAVEEFRKANCFDASMELAGLCNQVCDWRGAIEAYHSAIGFKDCDATAVLKGVRGMLPEDNRAEKWKRWEEEKVHMLLELFEKISQRTTSTSSMLQVISVLMLFGGKKRNFSKSLDLCLAAQKLPCQATVKEQRLQELLGSWGADTATKCTLEVCTQVLSRVVNDQERITSFLLGHNPRCGRGSFVWRLPQFVVGDIVMMLWVQNFHTVDLLLSELIFRQKRRDAMRMWDSSSSCELSWSVPHSTFVILSSRLSPQPALTLFCKKICILITEPMNAGRTRRGTELFTTQQQCRDPPPNHFSAEVQKKLDKQQTASPRTRTGARSSRAPPAAPPAPAPTPTPTPAPAPPAQLSSFPLLRSPSPANGASRSRGRYLAATAATTTSTATPGGARTGTAASAPTRPQAGPPSPKRPRKSPWPPGKIKVEPRVYESGSESYGESESDSGSGSGSASESGSDIDTEGNVRTLVKRENLAEENEEEQRQRQQQQQAQAVSNSNDWSSGFRRDSGFSEFVAGLEYSVEDPSCIELEEEDKEAGRSGCGSAVVRSGCGDNSEEINLDDQEKEVENKEEGEKETNCEIETDTIKKKGEVTSKDFLEYAKKKQFLIWLTQEFLARSYHKTTSTGKHIKHWVALSNILERLGFFHCTRDVIMTQFNHIDWKLFINLPCTYDRNELWYKYVPDHSLEDVEDLLAPLEPTREPMPSYKEVLDCMQKQQQRIIDCLNGFQQQWSDWAKQVDAKLGTHFPKVEPCLAIKLEPKNKKT
ncbi:hypothetical protein Pelo_12822 [Pelomyxa schiedti]|nr:hypothetical protein Pelo_12822 [Pelomyxa schiedti]